MTDKEQRILVDVITCGRSCVYRSPQGPGRSLCTHNGEMEQSLEEDCLNCCEGMTRAEAILILDNAIFDIIIKIEKNSTTAEGACNKVLDSTEKIAEAALDALIKK